MIGLQAQPSFAIKDGRLFLSSQGDFEELSWSEGAQLVAEPALEPQPPTPEPLPKCLPSTH